MKTVKRFLIYEYDTNLGDVLAESEDAAIAQWCALHSYVALAGLFAQEIC